jgi:hypothetical protein
MQPQGIVWLVFQKIYKWTVCGKCLEQQNTTPPGRDRVAVVCRVLHIDGSGPEISHTQRSICPALLGGKRKNLEIEALDGAGLVLEGSWMNTCPGLVPKSDRSYRPRAWIVSAILQNCQKKITRGVLWCPGWEGKPSISTRHAMAWCKAMPINFHELHHLPSCLNLLNTKGNCSMSWVRAKT